MNHKRSQNIEHEVTIDVAQLITAPRTKREHSATLGDIAGAVTEAVSPILDRLGDMVKSDDPRLSDSRKPLIHASTHSMAGDDRLLPEDIGAIPTPPADGKPYLVTSSGFVEYVAPEEGSGGGTTDHSQLENRAAADQHPIGSITHLESTLNQIDDDLDGLDAAIQGVADGLDGKVDVSALDDYATIAALNKKADKEHAHSISDVEGLQAALDAAGNTGGCGIGLYDPDKIYRLYDPPQFGTDNALYKILIENGPGTTIGRRNPIDEPVIGGFSGLLSKSVTLPLSGTWEGIAHGNGTFVAVSSGSNVAIYSTDGGETWNKSTLPASASWRCLTFGNGVFVALAFSSDKIAYSADGINWSSATLPAATTWFGLGFGNGMFVATTNGPNIASYSIDGINWTMTSLPYAADWRDVACGNGLFVASIYNSNKAAYSEDGKLWHPTTLPATDTWHGAAFGRGLFVMVASSNLAAYSADCVNWNLVTLPSVGNWGRIDFGNGLFVSASYGGNKAIYSDNGIDWNETTLSVAGNWGGIAFGEDRFIAPTVGANFAAVITPDVSFLDNCWKKIA